MPRLVDAEPATRCGCDPGHIGGSGWRAIPDSPWEYGRMHHVRLQLMAGPIVPTSCTNASEWRVRVRGGGVHPVALPRTRKWSDQAGCHRCATSSATAIDHLSESPMASFGLL